MRRTVYTPYSRFAYVVQAQCTLGDGSDKYSNTEPLVWEGWLGKYKHKGMRPPEFYYPDGPYKVNGVDITPSDGCYSIGITATHYYQSQESGSLLSGATGSDLNGACLIEFGELGKLGTKSRTLVGQISAYELKYYNENNTEMYFPAHPAPGPYTNTLGGVSNAYSPYGYGGSVYRYDCNGCCDIKYMVVGGEFPPDMVLNMDTGRAYGFISEMDLPDNPEDSPDKDYFLNAFRLPKDFQIDEENYATVGSAASFFNGRGGYANANFTIRAFNAKDPRVFSDKTFTLKVNNNWSSDRDRLVLNIKNRFYIDGKPATNKEYLMEMKKRGYFP
jgi:hypothetical protein